MSGVADPDACVFCAILRGALPVSLVAEEDRVVAFMDINPINPGHVLIIPRHHTPDLAGLVPDDGAVMFRLAQRVAAALRASDLPCDGVNLFLADGELAGQEVFHAHLHVIPRLADDGFFLDIAYGASPSREDLDVVAAELRSKLGE